MGSRGIPLMVTALNLARGWVPGENAAASAGGMDCLVLRGFQGMDVQSPGDSKNKHEISQDQGDTDMGRICFFGAFQDLGAGFTFSDLPFLL